MNPDEIPVVSVSYNSAELIDHLLYSFRNFYPNPITIIDGSNEQHYRAIQDVCAQYKEVRFIHFDYNIHHGPGMAWAFENLGFEGPVLVLDSDVVILRHGFLESMLRELMPFMYGVGYVNHVNEGGFDVDYEDGAVRYLHPACMLVNAQIVRRWPYPTKHGAPMITPMMAMHRAGQHDLIQGLSWLKHDFSRTGDQERYYLRHDWQGTVKRSGGYGLDEWIRKSQEAAELRLLTQRMLPTGPRKLFELGDNDALLGRACKESEPCTIYLAAGSHPDKASLGQGACDVLYGCNVDTLDDTFFRDHADTNCWILDQALERSSDPDLLIGRLRKVIRADATVVAIVPNAQHWSLSLRLAVGDLSYAEDGLLSPAHRRWFSQKSLIGLFANAGFRIVETVPLIRQPLRHEGLINSFRQIAAIMGHDPESVSQAIQPDQFIIKAVPC